MVPVIAENNGQIKSDWEWSGLPSILSRYFFVQKKNVFHRGYRFSRSDFKVTKGEVSDLTGGRAAFKTLRSQGSSGFAPAVLSNKKIRPNLIRLVGSNFFFLGGGCGGGIGKLTTNWGSFL